MLSKQIIAILVMVMSSYLVMAEPTMDHCSTCKTISQFVLKMEHNNLQSSLNFMNFYDMCMRINGRSERESCVFLATTMNKALKEVTEKDFCYKIKACPSKTSALLSNSPAKKEVEKPLDNPITCMICRQAVTILYKQLEKNATRENVENGLTKVCRVIFFKNKEKQKQCEVQVHDKAEVILQSFINKVPPELVCMITGACFTYDEATEPIDDVENFEDLRLSSSFSLGTRLRSRVSKVLHWAQDYKCYFCEKVADFVFKELNTTRTRTFIKRLLESSCSRLFKREDRESKCEEYVDEYTDKLIDLIEKSSNPAAVCSALHFCPANLHHKKAYIPVSSTFAAKKPLKIGWCTVCTNLYPFIHKASQIDEAREKLRGIAHNFCDANILPIDAANCSTNADKYLKVITDESDSKKGCVAIHLCDADQTGFNKRFMGPIKFPILDEVSKVLDKLHVKEVFDTLDEVGEAVEKVIKKVGEEFKKKDQKPDFDKKFISIPKQLPVELVEKVKELGNWWQDLKCTACKYVVKNMYEDFNEIIHDPHTKEFIARACEHIDEDELREKCKNDSYNALEILLRDFRDNLSPKEACESMNFCKKTGIFDRVAGVQLTNSLTCQTCKASFPALHRLLENEKVRQVVLNITTKACKRSPNPADCTKSATTLINNLGTAKDAAAGCASLCPKQEFNQLFSRVGDFKNSLTCAGCRAAYPVIHQALQNPKVKEAALNITNKACQRASKPADCVKAATTLINDLASGKDSVAGCASVCPKKQFNQLFSRVDDLKNCLTCNGCRAAYPVLHKALSNPKIKEAALNITNKACQRASKPADCVKAATTLINDLATGKDAATGCASVCPKKQFNQLFSRVGDFKNSLTCAGCRAAYPVLHQALQNPKVKEAALNITNKACQRASKPADCVKAATTLINDLASGKDSVAGCASVCPKKQFNQLFSRVEDFKNAVTCNGCRAAYPVLHIILQNEESKKAALNISNKACQRTTKPADCVKAATTLINDIASGKDAAAGCASVCPKKQFNQLLSNLDGSLNLSKCSKCQLAMLVVDNIVNSEDFKDSIQEVLDNFCKKRQNEKECNEKVTENLPKLYEFFERLVDRENGFCVQFNYCP